MKYLSLIVPSLVAVGIANASPPNEAGTQKKIESSPFQLSYSLPRETADLIVEIQDKTEVPNACNYYVQRFEYIRAINTLVVNVETQQPCLVDRIGKRTGELRWTLPQGLRNKGKFCVVVNQSKVGSVFFDRAAADFVVGQTESCE
jgi:hypothetical protein